MEEPKMNEGRLHEHDWEEHVSTGMKGLRADVMDKMKDFPSADFRMHTRAARREMLLAFRSLLDMAIDRLEDKPKPEEPKGRINIE